MDSFADKRQALFDCLDDASKELKGTSLDQKDPQIDRAKLLGNHRTTEFRLIYRNDGLALAGPSNELNYLRGKESIFKKPSLPITKCLRPRRTPDYQINPHKWKKYCLQDMDISENTNTSAAMAFLSEMDRRKERMKNDDEEASDKANSMDVSDEPSSTKKIEFKRSSKLKRNLKSVETEADLDPELDKAKFKGSKLVMPEYTIGQAPKSSSRASKKALKDKERAAGSLRLSHLEDQETEDDGNYDSNNNNT